MVTARSFETSIAMQCTLASHTVRLESSRMDDDDDDDKYYVNIW
jgi:hypothetical protein